MICCVNIFIHSQRGGKCPGLVPYVRLYIFLALRLGLDWDVLCSSSIMNLNYRAFTQSVGVYCKIVDSHKVKQKVEKGKKRAESYMISVC